MTPRNAIVMLVLGALCLLAYLMLSGPGATTAKSAPFVSWDKRDVAEVKAASQGEEFTLRRRLDSSDRWELGIAGYWVRANGIAVDEMLSALVRSEVRRHFLASELNPSDIAGWGLDKPRIVLDLQVPGKQVTYRIGGSARDPSSLYVDHGPGTDVWVVATEAYAELVNMFTNGVREFRIMDVATYDVKRMEILEGGQTRVAVAQDLSQIWRVSGAYDDYAHPQEFETNTLSPICTEKVTAWVVDGETILATYGLDNPRAELRLTRKQGGDPFVLYVGKEAGESSGGAYVMEKGTQSVGVAPKRFVDAVFRDPNDYRDRSFSRIGIDGSGITVLLDEGSGDFRLAKEGTEWRILKPPPRDPADGKAVRRTLDEVRNWHIHEFLDEAEPEDKGIDGKHLVRIDRASGDATTLLIGDPAGDGTWFAQRKGDSGVLRVGGGPIASLSNGVIQFRRLTVAEYITEELLEFGREPSRQGADQKVQKLWFARDDGNTPWRDKQSGATGEIDRAALGRLVEMFRTIVAEKWIHLHGEDRVKYGIHLDAPATTRFNLTFSERTGYSDAELEPILLIGKRREEGGGYYARLLKHRSASDAFILSDEVVKALIAPIIK